ncbi:coatomer epsilon subunit-domain-containing protein [Powellomyces hirtus]|nr:coatomer epsilon subunit-domain-containing protein [Powellomyces hirtus]
MGDFVDELRLLRNNFYLGSWQHVIDEALKGSEQKTDRQVLFYRAHIASNHAARAVAEIAPDAPADLQAVKLFAQYTVAAASGNAGDKARAGQDMAELLKEGNNALSSTVLTMAGSLLVAEERYAEALTTVVQSPRNLECVALAIQCYLKLDRVELARREVDKLKTWADDATLAQLAEAWVNCFQGGEQSVLDSQYIFEELASAKLSTGRLVAGLAICKMQAGKFPEAERILVEGLARYPTDTDLLANLVVCSSAIGKPADDVARIISTLKQLAPSHPLLEDMARKESLFARAALRYS